LHFTGLVHAAALPPSSTFTSALAALRLAFSRPLMLGHWLVLGFDSFVQNYDEKDPSTHKSLNLRTMTMGELFKYYNLDAQVRVLQHTMVLYWRTHVADAVLGDVRGSDSQLLRFSGRERALAPHVIVRCS